MNILIIIDVLNGHNGSFKIMRNIAYGLAKHNRVKILFFNKSDDYKNALPLLNGLNYDILTTKKLWEIENLFKKIIIKNHENIRLDDMPLFLIQFSMYRYLKKINFKPDLMIFSNYFSSLSLLVYNKVNSIVFFTRSTII